MDSDKWYEAADLNYHAPPKYSIIYDLPRDSQNDDGTLGSFEMSFGNLTSGVQTYSTRRDRDAAAAEGVPY